MTKKKTTTRKPAAKVSKAAGKIFLTVRGKKTEIQGVSHAQIGGAVGKAIEPVFYKKAVVAIQWKPGPGILCYIPAPDVISKIAPEVQQALLKTFIANGIITAAQGREIVGGN